MEWSFITFLFTIKEFHANNDALDVKGAFEYFCKTVWFSVK